jgi:hypothetical protein
VAVKPKDTGVVRNGYSSMEEGSRGQRSDLLQVD